ncbi:tetratricopeptide repeat protein [Sphingobacterium sp.]|uniref:tetratricopeptide repeat protein n=1 Tax=Sphingobacterium sp. TaxID=341027 RepID=UPI00289F7BD4|nr:tetratricopeptide repeat protein [Sphingobacterium sp.]
MMNRRYVSGLISPSKKVFKDIFHGSSSHKYTKTFSWWKILLSSSIMLSAFVLANNLLSRLILAAISTLFIPATESGWENLLRVKLVPKVQLFITVLLIIFSIPVSMASHHFQLQKEQERALLAQAEKQKKELEAKNEAIRKDSLHHYLKLLDAPVKDIDKSLRLIDRANTFAKFSDEIDQLTNKRNKLRSTQIDLLIKHGKYSDALGKLDDLIVQDKNVDHYYRRAVCYQKLRQPQEAVNDLTIAIELGSTAAQRLYNTINPLRKRIIGYVTRCCDGTTSNARGRGACSWHGGVCNWNDQIYQEYRQYE